ncbi:unnamed protein product [Symbiodinium sp. CCMP2592]|nr:unnamed protein product [Symbiodinium sp. CCMP2592]
MGAPAFVIGYVVHPSLCRFCASWLRDNHDPITNYLHQRTVRRSAHPIPNMLLYWLNWLVLLPPSSALLRRHSVSEAAVLSDPSLETCSPLVNHESFSSVEVRLGTPAQKLNLVADTGSNNVIVMSCACLLTKSCPKSFGTCFRGENVSSTFVLRNASASVLGSASPRESWGGGSAPESLLIEFGSGRIGAFVASDVVHVGSVRTFLEDSLLLMVKQKLSVPGPFEGILGLGQPPQGEAAAKKQVVSGFLEQANIQRFSMCFNYEASAPSGDAATWLLVMPVIVPVLYGYSMIVGDLPYIWAVLWVIHTCLFFVLAVVGSWLYRSNSLRSFGYFIEAPCHSNDLLIMLSWLPLVTAGAPCLIWGSFQDICDTSLLLVLGFLFVYMPLLDEPRVLPVLWVCYSGAAGARCADLRLRTSSASGVEVSSFAVRVLSGEAAVHAALRARMLYLNRTRTPLTASLLEERAQLQVQRPKGVEYWPDRTDGDAARIVRQVRARRRQRREELTGTFVWAIFFSQSLSPDLLLHILSFLQNVPLRQYAVSQSSTSLIPTRSNMGPSESSSMSSLTLLRRRFQAKLRSRLHPKPAPGPQEQESHTQEGRCCPTFQVLGIILSLAWILLIPPMILMQQGYSEEALVLEV